MFQEFRTEYDKFIQQLFYFIFEFMYMPYCLD